jgi:hypothetical protein
VSEYVRDQRTSASLAGFTTAFNAPTDVGYGSPRLNVLPLRRLSPDGTSDFSGDGRADVVEFRKTQDDESLAFRAGNDGHILWRWHQANLVGFVPVRVGAPARPGVVIAWVTPFVQAGLGPMVTLNVAAYDGLSGTTVWAYTHNDLPPTPFDQYEFPTMYLRAALRGYSGHAAAFVMSRTNAVPAKGEKVFVLSGADGSVHSGGNAVRPTWRYTADGEYWNGFGDIDGDGLADFGVQTASAGLIVRSSRTGNQLWSRADVHGFTAVPHTSGRFVDVDTDKGHLDGTNGHTRWLASDGEWNTTPVGDTDGDGIQDYTFLLVPPYAGAYTSVARSGRTGQMLWRKVVTSCSNGLGYRLKEPFAFDVQGDRVADRIVTVGGGCAPHTYIISGKDGTFLDGGDPGAAVGAAIDGNGDDFARAQFLGNGTARITTVDGLTRTAIWTGLVTVAWHSPHLAYLAADLTGDGHAELITEGWASQDPNQASVLDGATGHVLWTVKE